MAARYEFLDWPGPIPIAHRGGASEAPENTLPAFESAVQLGYRYVETDVHVTSDGVLLAFHDDHLDRVTDREGEIASLPWSEVSKARVDGREPIPLLADLLGTWPDLRINIDPKHDAAVEPLAEVIEATGAVDRVCVGSFSDRRIDRLRALLGSRLCTSLGPLGILRVTLGVRPPGGVACAQVPVSTGRIEVLTPRFLHNARRRGLPVQVWTIDEPAEIHRLLDLGVDGIMTDRPAVLKQILVERDLWQA
jgi:glycerophosphoryl diester phosphodiesterase